MHLRTYPGMCQPGVMLVFCPWHDRRLAWRPLPPQLRLHAAGRGVLCCAVQDFLKARGIVIDSTTVIQQAAVTGLSDSNSKRQAVLH